MSHRVRNAWLPVVALAGITAAAGAQSLAVRAVAAEIRHPLFGGLFGAALVATVPLGSSSIALEIAGERLVGNSSRFDVPCAGLIEPGTCRPEPLRDHGSSTAISIGLSAPAAPGRRVSFRAGGALALAFVATDTRGLVTGAQLSARKTLWRADVEGEWTWHPWSGKPLALLGGAAAGWQAPFRHEEVADGYTPLNQGAAVVRLWLGVSWRKVRRRS